MMFFWGVMAAIRRGYLPDDKGISLLIAGVGDFLVFLLIVSVLWDLVTM